MVSIANASDDNRLSLWNGAGAQIELIEACGHWAMLEQPEKIARFIRRFFDDLQDFSYQPDTQRGQL